MDGHRHEWVETTTYLQKYESRVCSKCKREQRRKWTGLLAETESEDGWQMLS